MVAVGAEFLRSWGYRVTTVNLHLKAGLTACLNELAVGEAVVNGLPAMPIASNHEMPEKVAQLRL